MPINRRILIRGAVACACCLKAGVAISSDKPAQKGAAAPHWSYQGDGNPAKWGELQPDFKMCQLGLEQTPIDLGNAIKGDAGSIDYDYKPLPLRLVNNGHTIQFNADPGSACVIGETRYELLQFHLHHPSEHLLAGKGFDLECHFVHKSSAGALAVTAVFIKPGTANVALKTFFEQMPAGEGPELKIASLIDLGAMLPKAGGYFRYMGSLTTPPCSEGLTWTVHKEAVEASVEQIKKFAALFPGNARPIQNRNRRFVIDAI